MSTNRIPSNPARERESLAAKQERILATEREKEVARIHALSAAGFLLGAALVVATISMTGCGGDDSQVVAKTEPAPAMQQNAVASIEKPQAPLPGSTQESRVNEVKGVPPDVVFAVSDTFVTAGQPIEVTASATEDVTEMALSDGRGDSLPMVRDSTGNTWRVSYRVPLRPRENRIGLSVTAKNETHQWRRVWLFLQVNDGKQEVETPTPADSTGEQR